MKNNNTRHRTTVCACACESLYNQYPSVRLMIGHSRVLHDSGRFKQEGNTTRSAATTATATSFINHITSTSQAHHNHITTTSQPQPPQLQRISYHHACITTRRSSGSRSRQWLLHLRAHRQTSHQPCSTGEGARCCCCHFGFTTCLHYNHRCCPCTINVIDTTSKPTPSRNSKVNTSRYCTFKASSA
jgi:hypothetical protein